MTLNQIIASIGLKIKDPLPGWKAHSMMAPATRLSNEEYFQKYFDSKRSGVLILLYPDKGKGRMLMIERAHRGIHSGQVGFPGGRFEDTDGTIENTALREASEETGVNPAQIMVMGRLSDLYIPASDFTVCPVVSFMEERPEFEANPDEVNSIIEADVNLLLSSGNISRKKFKTSYGLVEAPYFRYDRFEIWGATAMILAELKWMLNQ